MQLATIGHNGPPTLNEELGQRYAYLTDRKDELLEAFTRVPEACDDDETLARMTDFVGQLMGVFDDADSAHKVEKKPHLDAGRTVDSFFNSIREPMEASKKAIKKLADAYNARKLDQIRHEAAEAEKKARQEAEALAASATTDGEIDQAIALETKAQVSAQVVQMKPTELTQARGSFGTMSSMKLEWAFEIEDLTKVPPQFLMLNEAAVKAHMKARQKDKPPLPCPGIRFFEKPSTQFRR